MQHRAPCGPEATRGRTAQGGGAKGGVGRVRAHAAHPQGTMATHLTDPILYFPLKKTDSLDWVKPMKAYIKDTISQHEAENLTQSLEHLQRLRKAGCASLHTFPISCSACTRVGWHSCWCPTCYAGGGGGFDPPPPPTQRGRLWTACGQRHVDSKNSQTTPATTSTSSIRQLLGAADAQTAHPATSSTAPTHQLLGSANAETTPAGAPAAAATESSDPTQHAKGRAGDCPGPRKGATTRRNVTQGGGGGASLGP